MAHFLTSDDESGVFGGVDEETVVRHARRWLLAALVSIVAFGIIVGTVVAVALGVSNSNGGGDDDDESGDFMAFGVSAESYMEAVNAFAGGTLSRTDHVCWTTNYDDDSSLLYTLFKNPSGDDKIPMPVFVSGHVCYATVVVPGVDSHVYDFSGSSFSGFSPISSPADSPSGDAS